MWGWLRALPNCRCAAVWTLDFRHSSAAGSTLERWVLLLSLTPQKSSLARFLLTLETPNHYLGLMAEVVNPAVRQSAPGMH